MLTILAHSKRYLFFLQSSIGFLPNTRQERFLVSIGPFWRIVQPLNRDRGRWNTTAVIRQQQLVFVFFFFFFFVFGFGNVVLELKKQLRLLRQPKVSKISRFFLVLDRSKKGRVLGRHVDADASIKATSNVAATSSSSSSSSRSSRAYYWCCGCMQRLGFGPFIAVDGACG